MFEKIKNWINLGNEKEISRLESKINSLERQLNTSTRIMIGDYCGYPYDRPTISIAEGFLKLLKHQGLELNSTPSSVELVKSKKMEAAKTIIEVWRSEQAKKSKS